MTTPTRADHVRPTHPRHLLAAFVVCLTSSISANAAAATKWRTCHFEGSGGVGSSIALIVLEPFEVNADPKYKSPRAISEFIEGPGVGSVVPGYAHFPSFTSGCDDYDSHAEAQARAERVMGWGSYNIKRAVQWIPSRAVTGLGGPGSSSASVRAGASGSNKSSGPGATVEAAPKPPVVPGWDDKVREQLRKESDARAKAAALSAANDAKVKADVAEAIRKLKAKGRAQ
jgi:hypothetical protein